MDISDNLVKLASIGTAGISILAVFITGVIILKLPNDVSKEKTSLLKFFIGSCFVFIILSTGSAILNAMFNKEVIDEKEVQIAEVKEQYNTEKDKWTIYKRDVTAEIARIESQLNQPNINREALKNNIKQLNTKTTQMHFTPIKVDSLR